jgi:DNA-binding transcriptional LysR family regulator
MANERLSETRPPKDDRAKGAKSSTTQPSSTKPSSAKPRSAKPSAKPRSARPSAAKPRPAKPRPAKPSAKPSAISPGTTQPKPEAATRPRDRVRPTEPSLDTLRWDDVRVLLTVLRAGSFTLAARALGTEQSTVSRRIAALEAHLGAPLFERTPRGPRPTERAERLREAAERVDDEMHRFADVAAGDEPAVRGRVRIATSEGLAIHALVPAVLPALAKAHPELTIELATSERAVDLAAREADIALRFFRGGRGDLVIQRVATVRTAVLAHRTLARSLRGVPTSELPWIVVELPGIDTPEASWLRTHGGPPRLVFTSYEVLLAGVRAGLGVGLVPRAVLRTHRELVALDEPPACPPLEVFLVTRRAIRKQPRIAAVIDHLLATLPALTEA